MACPYKQKDEEEGGSGDGAVLEEVAAAAERRGWNSRQPHLPLPPKTHIFLRIFSLASRLSMVRQ